VRASIALLLACSTTLGASLAKAGDSDRIRQLEDEVAELRGQVERLVARDRVERGSRGGDDPFGAPRLPELFIGGFSDVSYAVERERPGSGGHDTTNAFELGDLDLFLSSRLSERISFLSEILIEFGGQGANVIDVERLLLKYEHEDWLRASAGRGHTPIGYWNTHFHHGTWLQTTVERPLLFEFEDEGGILPLHYLGLEGSGSVETGLGLFDYAVDVANGRGTSSEAIQLEEDLNDAKMLSLAVSLQPSRVEGLRVGANVLHDRIPPDFDDPGRQGEMDELIAGGYLVYLNDPVELLVEAQRIRHRDRGLSRSFDSNGGYAQLAYRIGKVKPYYRLDWLAVDEDDPFYLGDPLAGNTTQHTLGLRYDWARFVALKLELRRQLSEEADRDVVAGQASFAF
jgi:hypothetical protein